MVPSRDIWQRKFRPALTVLSELVRDGWQSLNVAVGSRTALTAEILFLRKQLAYYREHQMHGVLDLPVYDSRNHGRERCSSRDFSYESAASSC
jgi:hypothetical protein